MTNNEPDPQTEAMIAGAEVEKDAHVDDGVEHTTRVEPAAEKPLLTTDPEAEQDESIIEPTSS